MTRNRRLLLGPLVALLGACNMVISDRPMFIEADRGSLVPRDGIWMYDDDECQFDRTRDQSDWPRCALWLVIRSSGSELLLSDGKGQSERIGGLFASGSPPIVQARWVDEAKEPATAYYGFFGIEPGDAAADGQFTAASVWVVECRAQPTSDTGAQEFPGIGSDCRPSSKNAIRAAAVPSRRPGQVTTWRWVRAEGR